MRPLQHSPAAQKLATFASVVFTLSALVALTTACGSGKATSTTSQLTGNTQVTFLLTSTANDQLSRFAFGFTSLTLTSQSGKTVSLLSEAQNTSLGAELIHANGELDPLITVSVPQDIYTAATVQIQGGAAFTCVTFTPPSSGEAGSTDISTFAYGYVPNNMVTVDLPSPITVTGGSMGLLLDLEVSQSEMYSSCYNPNGFYTFSITPTFNLTPLSIATAPTSPQNGKVVGMNGEITAIGPGDSFTLTLAEAPRTLAISAKSSTVYQGVSGFSALGVGTFVNMDGAVQPDGSLLATRITVEDPSALDVLIGPVLQVTATQPVVNQPAAVFYNQLSQGKDEIADTPPYSISDSIFQVSSELNNLQSLPFVPTFNGANMVAGQNVYVTSATISLSGGVPWAPATTITLLPQSIDATIFATSTAGNFTDYSVTLAPYDLFPTLAMQSGQTTVLNNPNQVEVYVDSNTQMLNKQPLAAGSTMRFYGLVFNDNGTLRMDCAQVNDGVAFNPPANSNAQIASGKAKIVRQAGAGREQVIDTITRSN